MTTSPESPVTEAIFDAITTTLAELTIPERPNDFGVRTSPWPAIHDVGVYGSPRWRLREPIIGTCNSGLGGCGTPFYDGGTDALDFFTSTPNDPFVPRNSRTMPAVSHDAKQQRRVAEGFNSPYNPLWELLDTDRLGITGHSYGAEAASWLGQSDPRLDAVVAWDSLCVPVWPSPDEATSFANAPINRLGGLIPVIGLYGFDKNCFGAPEGPTPALAKPALGINGDYLLAPIPYVLSPSSSGYASKDWASRIYSAAGVDSGQIVIRGGTHIDFMVEPTGTLPASLRGVDITAWYTVAWFDKYLKGDPSADARLLSTRWRNDSAGQAVDPSGSGNLFSYHYRSRFDIGLSGGGRFVCNNLRASCPGQVPGDADGVTGPYWVIPGTG